MNAAGQQQWTLSPAIANPQVPEPDVLLQASEIASLGDLLGDFLSDMEAFKGRDAPSAKEPVVVASPTHPADRIDVVREEREHEVSAGKKLKLPTRQRPSDTVKKKSTTHKRVRSASAHASVLRKDENVFDQPLPLLLLPSGEQTSTDRESVDDSNDFQRRKMPRVGAQTSWILAPGLTPDEKQFALPLLFNERLPYEHEADGPVFAALESSVSSQMAGLGDIFRSEGLTPSVTSTRRSIVEPSGENGPFLKFVSAKLMPFSFEVIAETVRQFALQSALRRHATDKTPPNILYAKQRYYLRPDQLTDSVGVPLLLRCAFQHATESDRMLGAWSGTGEWPDEMSSEHGTSAPIREQGWVLIQRCPTEDISKGSRLSPSSPLAASLSRCLVQSCLYVTPGLSDGAIRSDKSYLDVLSTVTAPSYQKFIDEREQILENRFMDQMLQIRAQQRARSPGYTRSSSL